MNLTQDLEIWTLIANASIVVKTVMVLLLAVSFMSWMFIFQKWFSIRRAAAQTDKFEREFWGGKDLNALYQGAVNHRHSIGSLERIFEAGFREFAKLRSGQRAGTDASDMVDGARRAMRARSMLAAFSNSVRARSMKARYCAWNTTPPASVSW